MMGILFILAFLVVAYFVYLEVAKRKASGHEVEKLDFPKNFGWTLLLAVLGFNLFSYNIEFGIGLGLLNVFLIIAILMAFEKKRRTPFILLFAGLGGVAALLFGFRGNEFVQGINALVVAVVLVGLVFLHSVDHVNWKGLWIIRAILSFIVKGVTHIPLLLLSPNQVKDAQKSLAVTVIKTGVITLIVLGVFVGLLSSADPIFNDMIAEIRDEAFIRTIVSLVIVALLTLALTIRLKLDADEKAELKFLGFYEVVVPVGGTVLLFAAFLFVQTKYLFGGHANVEAFDMTYSEYVRKGFIELMITAFLGGLLAYVVVLKQQIFKAASEVNWLRWLNVALILELFCLLASAAQRDLIYVETYGLTRVRIIGGIFLAWLAISLLLLLVVNLWKRMEEKHLFSGVLGISVVAFLTLNVLNIDHMIATSNMEREGYKDIFYTSMLSTDAAEDWLELIKTAQQSYEELYQKTELTEAEQSTLVDLKLAMKVMVLAREKLERAYLEEDLYIEKYYGDYEELPVWAEDEMERSRKWQSYNWSERRAVELILENETYFYDVVDCLLEEIHTYQVTYELDLNTLENDRLYEFEYPFINRPYIWADYFDPSVSAATHPPESCSATDELSRVERNAPL